MKPTITLFIGGGDTETYLDCEIDHQLAPEMTFTGHLQRSPFRYALANDESPKVKITTTCAYKIEFPVDEPNVVKVPIPAGDHNKEVDALREQSNESSDRV